MKILLAVSGGIDSMYMANRASELFPGATPAVAHCNFTLRGGESDMDEQFVRGWCREHGIVCHVKRFQTAQYAAAKGISIEMAARELRYSWFSELCGEYGYEAVAVAHNANDNAETLVLNLLRGTGTKGIRGMSDRPGVLRPLLGTDRDEIRRWMTLNRLPWREDSSNSVNDVKRNMIRNEVFPVFRRINPSFIRTFREDMRRFAQADDIAEDYFQSVRESLLDMDGNILTAPLMDLKHWKYVLWRLLEGSGIRREEFNSLTEVLESGRQYAGKVFGPVTASSGRLVMPHARQEAESRLCWEVLPRTLLEESPWRDGVTIVDADTVPFPLRIRKWNEGDWMHPLGMKGRKKLSDIFTDLKYDIVQRREADVLELDGHHVAALIGKRIDDSVKVTPGTMTVVRLYYRCSSMNTSSPGSAKP